MTKPPASTPHSDIDGVHQDERRNVDVATDLGESGEELERAAQEDVARPPHSDDQKDRDNRTA